jgi:peptidoglycan hydrolase CwlO-like protein
VFRHKAGRYDTRKTKCEENLSSLRAENLDLSTKNTELAAQVSELKKIQKDLEKDTAENGIAYRRLVSLNHELALSEEKLQANIWRCCRKK